MSWRAKTIGIIGGAGPMAGSVLTKHIIERCQKVYGCKDDADFPRLLMVSYPFAQMLKPESSQQKDDLVKEQLYDCIAFLKKSGADYIIIACNTLHAYLDEPRDSKIIHLIEETTQILNPSVAVKTLVLSTTTSSLSNVYDVDNMVQLSGDDQNVIDQIIDEILSGQITLEQQKRCLAIANRYLKDLKPCNQLVLGCSEFSVLADKYPFSLSKLTIIDPLKIIAKKVCQLCLAPKRTQWFKRARQEGVTANL